jgi:hypothetical protein
MRTTQARVQRREQSHLICRVHCAGANALSPIPRYL